MTTRSGRIYNKPTGRDQGQEEPTEASGGTETAVAGNSIKAASLAKLMELLIEDRHKQEQEITEERVQWEREMDRRIQDMRQQMERMESLVEEWGRQATGVQPGEVAVKLSKLNDSDIEGYLLRSRSCMVGLPPCTTADRIKLSRHMWPWML